MLLVGLTGSIGMGKSETARMFAELGVPVYDADAAVHTLYGPDGEAVERLRVLFPSAIVNGAVDRTKLGALTLHNPEALKALEKIIHPLVGAAQLHFLANAETAHAPMVVLDIPLLFETGGEARVDAVVVVSAPAPVQRERVLKRPGMTAEKFEAILARQTPDAEKRARADIVIDTSQGLAHAFDQVKRAHALLLTKPARVWAQRKAALGPAA